MQSNSKEYLDSEWDTLSDSSLKVNTRKYRPKGRRDKLYKKENKILMSHAFNKCQNSKSKEMKNNTPNRSLIIPMLNQPPINKEVYMVDGPFPEHDDFCSFTLAESKNKKRQRNKRNHSKFISWSPTSRVASKKP